jgi:hypothetical protein
MLILADPVPELKATVADRGALKDTVPVDVLAIVTVPTVSVFAPVKVRLFAVSTERRAAPVDMLKALRERSILITALPTVS